MIDWIFYWGLIASAGAWLLAAVVSWAKTHPVYAALAALAFVRMWGTTVRTGYAGVLFRWGRAKKVLEPGFHTMIPIVHEVRKLPVRSVTLQLPPQRLATADGLVYDVDATVVLRIGDPVKATTEVDDLRAGVVTVLSLAVADVIRSHTREDLTAKAALDAEIAERVRHDLERWGVTVEQAGLNTIAPTRTTTRLSQQRKRLLERADALRRCLAAGLSPETALTLLGPTRRLVGRSSARYHRHRPAAVAPPAPDAPPEDDDEPLDDDLPI